jgi:ATP-binding cassette subfamily B protein
MYSKNGLRKAMASKPPIKAKAPLRPKKYLSFFTVLRFAAGYWRRQPRKLAVILVMLVVSAGLETYLPSALSSFLGTIRQHEDAASVYYRLFVFLVLYAGQAALFASTFIVYNTFETRVFKALVDDAFTHVHSLSEHFFINTFTGSIISKINRGRQKIETFEDQILLRVFPTSIILIGSTIFLALRFPTLALLMVVYLGILITASFFLVLKFAGPAQGAYADAQDSFIAHLADSVSGISATKSYAQEKIEIEHFVDITGALRTVNVRAYTFGSTAGMIQRLMLAGMLAMLLGGGTWYFFHGQASVENMAYLAFAYTIMQSYIRDLGENIKNLLTSSYDLHAVIALMHEKPEVEKMPALPALDIRKGEIVFDKVRFTYPGKKKPIFTNLCTSIRAGERVALVGHSGSGKTSFVRLLQCLYTTQEGHIFIDGQDIALGSRKSLRSAISLVPQDPVLFHRTLRENIAYGKPEATMEEIRAAAQQANIDPFILSLPLQYETLVGERGIKLSGGERQRIAIARAMLANRPILVLDEATSSLDSISERSIQEALRLLSHGRTSIMIAHRLSTILDADRILVFDKGKIVEEGTHNELILKDNGIYAGFFKLQSGGFIKG